MRKIKVTQKQYKRILFAYRLMGFFCVLLTLILYSILIHKEIQLACILVPYFITREFYNGQFHSTSLKQCLVLSIVIFALAITVSMNTYVSILFSCMLGLAMALISYKASMVQAKLEDYDYIEPRYNDLVEFYKEQTSFNVKNCTEQELVDKCKSLGFNDSQIDFCVKAFVDKLSQGELANIFSMEVQSVKNKKQFYKDKLSNS